MKIDVSQDTSIWCVAEIYRFECNRALSGRNGNGAWGINDVVLSIQDFEASFRTGSGAFHCPRRVGERLQRLVKHQEICAENQKRAERERARQNMHGADVIHHCGADYHQRADHKRAVHVSQSQPQVGL